MSEDVAGRVSTIRLEFSKPPGDARKKPVRDNLSAVAASDRQLWFGTDEGTLLDCLTSAGDGRYAGHVAFDLKQSLTLPNISGKRDEIDIEGLSVDDGCLWLVGSHAVTRGKAEPKKDGAAKAIKELGDTDENPNRRTLARFQLDGDASSGSTLGAAAQLHATKETSPLLEILADDPHLGPFLRMPAKENGFDIEGLAVRGGRAFIGLRGPVLRGWALLLEVAMAADDDGTALSLLPNGPGGRRYRKHFLELEGCGVRDLCFADGTGNEMLVLAGPTMALDGTIRVHRWTVPDGEAADTITVADDCPALMDIPHRRGRDRAEGMALIDGPKGPGLLVVYDSPAPDRCHGETFVDADVFALPG